MDVQRLLEPVHARAALVNAIRYGLAHALTHRPPGPSQDRIPEVVERFHAMLCQELGELRFHHLATDDQSAYIGYHLVRHPDVGAKHREEQRILVAAVERLHRRDDQSLFVNLLRRAGEASSDIRHVRHAFGESHEPPFMEQRCDDRDVVEVSHDPPRIVGDQHVAGLERIGRVMLQHLLHRDRNRSGLGSDADIGGKEPSVRIEQQRAEIASFDDYFRHRGPDHGIGGFVDNGDQPVPEDFEIYRVVTLLAGSGRGAEFLAHFSEDTKQIKPSFRRQAGIPFPRGR